MTIQNSLAAGSVAGMASTLACHPFDVLRVKMQASVFAVDGQKPLGLPQTFRDTVRNGGFRALYTGLSLPLGAQAIYKATVFTVNTMAQNILKERKSQEWYQSGEVSPYQLTMGDRFLCGFLAGAANGAIFVTPVEFVRNQLITRQNTVGYQTRTSAGGGSAGGGVTSPFQVMQRTISVNGIQGLWRGVFSTVIRDSFGCGCFFVAMAYSQELLAAGSNSASPSTTDGPSTSSNTTTKSPPTLSTLVISGAIAGVSFWIWALPIDTMKTWIQNGSARNLHHVWLQLQDRGLRPGLASVFQGWQVAYSRGVPSAAVTVTVYSLLYQYLEAL